MANKGGIYVTHNAQLGNSRGLVVVSVPGEVPIWLALVVSILFTMRKWLVVVAAGGSPDMAGRGGSGALHTAQMSDSRGLVVVSVLGEVPIWLSVVVAKPFILGKWVLVEV